jgi:hypothetical protein
MRRRVDNDLKRIMTYLMVIYYLNIAWRDWIQPLNSQSVPDYISLWVNCYCKPLELWPTQPKIARYTSFCGKASFYCKCVYSLMAYITRPSYVQTIERRVLGPVVNCKVCGRERPWPNRRHYPGTYRERLRNLTNVRISDHLAEICIHDLSNTQG